MRGSKLVHVSWVVLKNTTLLMLKPIFPALAATCVALFAVHSTTQAQWSAATEPQALAHQRAIDAFENQQFALALHTFESLIDQATDPSSDAYVEAKYYASMSALALFHKDAVYQVEHFIQHFPESPLAEDARWELANYHYQRRAYRSAIDAFRQISVRELDHEKRNEYRFKLGHCHFEKEEYQESRIQLYDVLNVESKFQAPAQYYFAHIAYINDQPQVALDGFEKIADNPEFKELVPLYITQLLHATGQFERLKEYAPPLLDESNGLEEESVAEVAHLLGDAWFRENNYAAASPYLELAWESKQDRDRNLEFAYQVGLTRYHQGDLEGAKACLAQPARFETAVGQNAAYHLGDVHLKLNEKTKAQRFFKSAASLDFDLAIQEDAFFHYAKLSYELSYNPFDDAIVAFESFIEQFPNSPDRDDAYRFLLDVYMTSRNYELALEALDKIEQPDDVVLESAQVLAFNHAVDLFQNNQLALSLNFFQRSRGYGIDPQLVAESFFWQGEIHYRKGEYEESAESFKTFSTTPGSYLSPLHDEANYARGYAHFQNKEYSKALTAFRSYLKSDPEGEDDRLRDAELRIADCFRANKSYGQAVAYYDKVLDRGVEPLDYALFHRAMTSGYMENYDGQLAGLNQLVRDYPTSRYIPEALYQSGRTNIQQGNLTVARTEMERVRSEFQASPRAKQALVELCLIGMAEGNQENVLELWGEIKLNFGNDNIASDAYSIVEPLLLERGLTDDLPSAVGLDGSEIERRYFQSAKSLVMEKNWQNAIVRLNEYQSRYPLGIHVDEANFNLGNCHLALGDTSQSYQAFVKVLDRPASEFTEHSAMVASSMAWEAQDIQAALGHYQTLESVSVFQSNRLMASIGQMRCHYYLGQDEEAVKFASRVMNDPGAPKKDRQTATLLHARMACDQGNHVNVLDDLRALTSIGGETGAEAQYLLAEYEFIGGRYEECRVILKEFIENHKLQEGWWNKGLLLWVRTHMAEGDLEEARNKATTIVEHVEATDVQEAVADLLLEIERLESEQATNKTNADNNSSTDDQ